MRQIEKSLINWKKSLCDSITIGGLFSRSKVAHKWKAPYRSLELRETISWRTQDLLEQSLVLYDNEYLLGARILLRSAFESIAVLIYLNQLTKSVLEQKLGFHEFSKKTEILLLGSRDDSTPRKSLNIITILEKCNRKYPGLLKLYGALSESAHPNFEGTCIGYTETDKHEHIITFSNKWKSMYNKTHLNNIENCYEIFLLEYNEEWPSMFEKLEKWIEENDDDLEATREKA